MNGEVDCEVFTRKLIHKNLLMFKAYQAQGRVVNMFEQVFQLVLLDGLRASLYESSSSLTHCSNWLYRGTGQQN